MIAFYWSFIHFIFFIYFLFIKKNKYYNPFFLFLLFIIYVFKDPTYDLVWYLDYFSNPYLMKDFLFYTITDFFVFFGNPLITLWFYFFINLFLIIFSVKINEKFDVNYSIVVLSVLVLGSIFFVLGTQNAIRQSLALSFFLLYISLSYRSFFSFKNIFLIFLFASIAIGIHWSSYFYFFLYFLFVLFFPLKNKFIFLVYIGLGILIYYLISHYMAGGTYVDESIDWGDKRTSSSVKLFFVSILFFITDYLFRKKNHTSYAFYLLEFRFFLFFVMLPLSMLPEAYARILYFYNAVELLLMLLYSNSSYNLHKYAVGLWFLSAGFAPNAINILSFVRS